MRISGTETSAVTLSQTKYMQYKKKIEKGWPKSAETSQSQKGWYNKPTRVQ